MDMSTLKDRLRGIVKPASDVVSDGPPGYDRTGDAMSGASRTESADVCRTLGGDWRETAAGRSLVITRRFAPDQLHGRYRVDDFAATLRDSSSAASLVGRSAADVPFVFFDLETTGLNGGAGTHAFLIGCGWFDEDGGFVTEQHLMTDFGHERTMLGLVASDFRRAGTLMSFNGKSFDAPMLETRYLFHRLESPCAGRPHVDLLHPARRLWGGAAETACSLGVLEQQVLSVTRVGDVPGFEIPARYFRFIRSGDATSLVDVLQHNRIDLLSLAGLTARILSLVEAGPDAAAHPREAVALARVYRDANLDERAERAYECALALVDAEAGNSSASQRWVPRQRERSAVKVEALRALALGARRQRRYERAADRWRQLLELAECPPHVAREANEALAIYHEHRARDLTSAKEFALRGVEMEAPARGDAARHRLARIERKMVSEKRSLFPSSIWPPSSGSPRSGRQTSS